MAEIGGCSVGIIYFAIFIALFISTLFSFVSEVNDFFYNHRLDLKAYILVGATRADVATALIGVLLFIFGASWLIVYAMLRELLGTHYTIVTVLASLLFVLFSVKAALDYAKKLGGEGDGT